MRGRNPSWEGGSAHDRESAHSSPRNSEVRNQCPKCGETKPVSEFATDRSKASGHKSWCKACDNEKSKRYYRANAEAVIARVSKRAAGRGRRQS